MGDLTDIEIFAEELNLAISRDHWIENRHRLVLALNNALKKTLSRRAQSEDASRKRGE